MTREKADGRVIWIGRLPDGTYLLRWGMTDVGHYPSLTEAVAAVEDIFASSPSVSP